MTDKWLAMTRPGYETDFFRELAGAGTRAGGGEGWILVALRASEDRKPWKEHTPSEFVFARQLIYVFATLKAFEPGNLHAMVAQAAQEWRRTGRMAVGFHSVFVEAPDNESGRMALQRFENLEGKTTDRLEASGLMPKRRRGLPRLHIFLDADKTVYLGLSDPATGSKWPMGAPKIPLPPEAPSRSARKLAEALAVFIPASEMEGRIEAGMRAVDLGAAPGGWSWLASSKGLIVDAVDNGALDETVFDMGLVTHIRADGYSYRPAWPVDWLFCDIVGGAPRIARLVSNWVTRSLCREAIFNLKLGEGDRQKQLAAARKIITDAALRAGITFTLKMRHLYHDRDEVTAHFRLLAKNPEKAAVRSAPRDDTAKSGSPGRKPKAKSTGKGAAPRDDTAKSGSRGRRPKAKSTGKGAAPLPFTKKPKPAARGSRPSKPGPRARRPKS